MKIMHLADLHIGSFPGPEQNGENARFLDLKRGLTALTDQAKTNQPSLILISGDLFHQAKVWSDRGLKEQSVMVQFLRNMEQIAPVFVLRGTPNHDSAEQFHAMETTFENDGQIQFATKNGWYEAKTKYGEPVHIAALPGFHRGLFQEEPEEGEPEGPFYTARINETIRNLSLNCPQDGAPSILMAHYTVEGCSMESGQTAFFSNTEPIITTQALENSPFSVICLGHIHKPQRIPGCPRAFYSGAMARLNFNDEGQDRGFFEHILTNGVLQASAFIPMPCRAFQTVSLSADDVSRIIEGTENIADKIDVKDAIVRVRYACDEAQRKQLTAASIERRLLKKGAFWTAEITPVPLPDKTRADSSLNTQTPAENLKAYLANAPDQSDRLCRLAEPLFQETQQESVTQYASGRFVPVEISVHNYRNYVDAAFCYDSIHFCTINGENGAGKSSLFMDAVVDALYEIPREGDLAGWIRNDPSVKSGQIRFTFKLGGALFRVTRSRRKSGSPSLRLEREKDGIWIDLSKDKTRDTQAMIEQIIGMDALMFRSCVCIMQDQYDLFLSANPSERMDILSNLLGLGIYDELEKAASENLTDANRKNHEISAQISQLETSLTGEQTLMQEEQGTAQQLALLDAQAAALTEREKRLQNQITTARLSEKRAASLREQQAKDESWKKELEQTGKTLEASVQTYQETLSRRTEIEAGAQLFRQLEQKERALTILREREKSKKDQYAKALREKAEREDSLQSKDAQLSSLRDALKNLEDLLCREPELERAAEQYRIASRHLTDLYAKQQENHNITIKAAQLRQDATREAAKRERDIQTQSAQIEQAEKQIALMDQSGCIDIQKASCRFLKEAKDMQQLLPAWIIQRDNMRKSLSDWQTEQEKTIRKIEQAADPSVDDEIQKALAEKQMLEEPAAKYAALSEHKGRRDQIKLQIAAEEKARDELRIAVQTANQTVCDLQADQNPNIEQEYQDIVSQMNQEKHWASIAAEIPVLEEKLNSAQSLLETTRRQIAAQDEIMKARGEEIENETRLCEKMQELTAENAAVQAESRAAAEQIRMLTEQKGRIARELETIQEGKRQKNQLQKELQSAAQTAADYQTLKRAFSSDGIRRMIVQAVLPELETTASSILSQMSGGQMNVRFITSVVKSNKKEAPTLDIIVDDIITGSLPYKSRSGGERVKAALSIILGLSELKCRSAGIQLGFLGIDEPPYLDARGAQAYCDALDAIQQRYPDMKIMAITHDPSMKGRFPQSIEVVKTPQGSRVIRE